MYTVIMKGVYIQGIHGLYATLHMAAMVAQKLAMSDEDNYHDWEVWELVGTDQWESTGYSFKKYISPTQQSRITQYEL